MKINKLFSLFAFFTVAFTFLACDSGGGGGDDTNGSSSSVGGGSSSGGSGGESMEIIEVYTIIEKGDDYIEYEETQDVYSCNEGVIFAKRTAHYIETLNYSIENNIMSVKVNGIDDYDEQDSINFIGKSNELNGTWTRTRNKETSCEEVKTFGDVYYECKEDWDLTKLEITDDNIKFTTKICPTEDGSVNEDELPDGWKSTIIDCNSIQLSKGSEKMTVKITGTGMENSMSLSYEDESCTMGVESLEKRIETNGAACKKAWDEHGGEKDWQEYMEGYVEEYMEEDFMKFGLCLSKILPEDILLDLMSGGGGGLFKKAVH